MCVSRIVHDGEVLLVNVVLVQREGHVGEPEPELAVHRHLQVNKPDPGLNIGCNC